MVGRAGIQYWGPSAWNLMHTVSFNYPESPTADERKEVFDFLHATAKLLPCLRCRRDWTGYLAQQLASDDSSHLDSRDALSRFLVDGHNRVNQKLGKPLMNYETVRALYIFDSESTARYDLHFRIAALVIVLMIAYVVFFKRRGAPD